MFRPVLAAIVAATIGFSLPAAAHDGVHVNDAYARISPLSGAVFLVVVNHALEDDRLIAARTDAAENAELHTHTEDANGVMQMRAVPEGFVIPGLGEHALARGGDHVMLTGLTRPLVQGDRLTLILTFERAGEVTVDVPVDNDRKPDAPGSMHHMDHDMPAAGN